MDTYTLLVFVLVALGFAVMATEVMVPSLGLLSLLALCCFAGSTYFAWKAWYVTDQLLFWWSYVFGLLLAIPSAVFGMFYVLPRTAFGRRAMAIPPRPEEVRPYVVEEARLQLFVGKEGVAASMHSPGGMVTLGFEKFHSESEGVLIDAGTKVIVVGLKGNRLVVRPLSMHQLAVVAEVEIRDVDEPRLADDVVRSEDAQTAQPAASDAIDFDVPDAT
jgi:membrane-bound ClpP family serine protease